MSFPSGAWKGYWTQPGSSRFFGMRLSLTFSEGRLTGNGTDEVGAFLVRGGYEDEAVWWVKAYLGQHSVDYIGRAAGRSLQGSWEVPSVWGGGFRIWPEGEDALSGEFLVEETTVARTAQWSETPVFTAVQGRSTAGGAVERAWGRSLNGCRGVQWPAAQLNGRGGVH